MGVSATTAGAVYGDVLSRFFFFFKEFTSSPNTQWGFLLQQQACVKFPTRLDWVITEPFLKYSSTAAEGNEFELNWKFINRFLVHRKLDQTMKLAPTMLKSLGQVLVFEVHATAVTGRTPLPRSTKDIWGHKQHNSKPGRKRTHTMHSLKQMFIHLRCDNLTYCGKQRWTGSHSV